MKTSDITKPLDVTHHYFDCGATQDQKQAVHNAALQRLLDHKNKSYGIDNYPQSYNDKNLELKHTIMNLLDKHGPQTANFIIRQTKKDQYQVNYVIRGLYDCGSLKRFNNNIRSKFYFYCLPSQFEQVSRQGQ
ncbi:MAG: hypothetical protein HRU28_01685 [Rhizobiales bacterium]|nr:hypothetical protein [Hyphomicrobiales bacterium]